MKQFAFPKKERLTDKRKISQLFAKAKAQSSFPLRALYSITPKDETVNSPIKITVAVPKRAFKRAVKRNLLKRRMREAYRLNKEQLYNAAIETNQTIEIVFIYLGKAEKGYEKIEHAMVELLQVMHQKATETQEPAQPNTQTISPE